MILLGLKISLLETNVYKILKSPNWWKHWLYMLPYSTWKSYLYETKKLLSLEIFNRHGIVKMTLLLFVQDIWAMIGVFVACYRVFISYVESFVVSFNLVISLDVCYSVTHLCKCKWLERLNYAFWKLLRK